MLEVLFFLFTFTAISGYLNSKVFKLPFFLGTAISSLTLMLILEFVAKYLELETFNQLESMFKQIDFESFVLKGVIVFLLFASAIKFEIANLKKWWWQITTLATVGVVVSMFAIAGLIYLVGWMLGTEFDILYCLLFGAIISPTDPPAAMAVLRSMKSNGRPGAPAHIEIKLLGESLFNDGMGIVLFLTILGLIHGKEFNFLHVTFDMIVEIFGAIILGSIWGFVYKLIINTVKNFNVLVLFTLSLAIGSFVSADYAHVSSPIAVVIAGLFIGHNLSKKFEGEQLEHLHKFWDFVDELLNASLFTLMGVTVLFIHFSFELVMVGILSFFLVILGRYIGLMICFAYPKWKGKVLNGSIPIISYGGIRGGISIALGLSIINDQGGHGNGLAGVIFIVVMMSNLIQGLTFKYMIQAFYPTEESQHYTGWNRFMQNLFNLCNRENKVFEMGIKENVEKGIRLVKESFSYNGKYKVPESAKVMKEVADLGIASQAKPEEELPFVPEKAKEAEENANKALLSQSEEGYENTAEKEEPVVLDNKDNKFLESATIVKTQEEIESDLPEAERGKF